MSVVLGTVATDTSRYSGAMPHNPPSAPAVSHCLRAMLRPTLTALAVVGTGLGLSGHAQAPNWQSDRPSTTNSQAWYANTAFYQVFVRSFQDSDGDGIGDFKGLTSRLDYLQDLGVGALWLMPIFASPSYHGYDVTDYQAINPQYGTLADFDAFLGAAKARGIRVILDWIPNHSSRQHPWFQEARESGSAKRDWYLWRNQDPGWQQPWGGGRSWHASGSDFFYGAFWDGMPDLNWRNPGVEQALNEAAQFWLKRGIDGFRVDAVRYLVENPDNNLPETPETFEWMRRFMKTVKDMNPDAAVVGEVWTDASTVGKYFLDGEGQNLGFNFDFQQAMLKAVNGKTREPLEVVLRKVAKSYPTSAIDATFTSNHDLPRPNYFNPIQHRISTSLLLTLPGTPFLYYGQEIAMPNGAGGADEHKRTPMRWDKTDNAGFSKGFFWFPMSTNNPEVTVEAQLAQPESLLNHHKRLLRLRLKHTPLRVGGYAALETGKRSFSFIRHHEGEHVVVLVNLDTQPNKLTLNFKGTMLESVRGPVQELTLGKTLTPLTDQNIGNYSINLAAGGLVMLKVGE
jgi:alpha-amylase